MQTRRQNIFAAIRTEGAILPVDLLQRIAEGKGDLEGLSPEAYHLAGNEKLNEAINHSWNRMLGAWTAFRAFREKLPEGDTGTSPTRERWLLPLFQELGYGRLLAAKSITIEDKTYAISHGWQHTPIHLVGCGIDIGVRTPGVRGAAGASPHSLVQELLNRSEERLWGFLSNGLRIRILRDNVSLTRQAYVEFDLEAMMEGEVYSDFVVLWLLCHQSRVEAERPEQCWLEKWSQSAQQTGTRALEQLRAGVEEAINSLGRGFLSHPANRELREKLRTGTLSGQDYYRQLLRTVYRLIFLFVAEDRELLLDPEAPQEAKGRYTRHYSTARIRRLAERRRGSKHPDLWRGLSLVFEKLGVPEGCPELALPALGSFLWSPEATPDLVGWASSPSPVGVTPSGGVGVTPSGVVGVTPSGVEADQLPVAAEPPRSRYLTESELRGTPCDIANADLLDAIRALAFTTDGHSRRPVDYRNLGAEELGSIYESLLELHPVIDLPGSPHSQTPTPPNSHTPKLPHPLHSSHRGRPRTQNYRLLLHAHEPHQLPA